MNNESKNTHYVGSLWDRLSDDSKVTAMTEDRACDIVERLNRESEEVRAGNSPYFITQDRSYSSI
jgi:hypothetical protein